MFFPLLFTFLIAYGFYRLVLAQLCEEHIPPQSCPECQQIDAPITVVARTEIRTEHKHHYEQVPISKDCPTCDGVGSIEVYQPDQATHILYRENCRDCYGTGKILSHYEEVSHSEAQPVFRFDYHCSTCAHEWSEEGTQPAYQLRLKDLNTTLCRYPRAISALIIFPAWLLCAYFIADDPHFFSGIWGIFTCFFALIVGAFIWIVVGGFSLILYEKFAIFFNFLPLKFKLKRLSE